VAVIPVKGVAASDSVGDTSHSDFDPLGSLVFLFRSLSPLSPLSPLFVNLSKRTVKLLTAFSRVEIWDEVVISGFI